MFTIQTDDHTLRPALLVVDVQNGFVSKGGSYDRLGMNASNIDQILTDVNTDFAEYRLFVCKTESTFIHADIHCKDFKGKCPSDASILVEVKEIPPTKCPRCTQDLASESKYPLEMNDNST